MRAQELVSRAPSLASFPGIFHHINEVIERPGSSAADIAGALSHDQSLTARLLRIANSAFYGFPSRVDTVSQAVVVVGTRQIRDLSLATLAITQFASLDPRHCDMRSFWRHSLASAMAARSLARRRRDANTERFFVGTLLHDVGSLIIYTVEPERAAVALQMSRDEAEALWSCERQVLETDHAAVGEALLASWKLPPSARAVAAFHHRFASDSPHALDVAVAQLADVIAHTIGAGTNGESLIPRLHPAAWDAVGVPPALLEDVAAEVERGLDETERVFLGDPR